MHNEFVWRRQVDQYVYADCSCDAAHFHWTNIAALVDHTRWPGTVGNVCALRLSLGTPPQASTWPQLQNPRSRPGSWAQEKLKRRLICVAAVLRRHPDIYTQILGVYLHKDPRSSPDLKHHAVAATLRPHCPWWSTISACTPYANGASLRPVLLVLGRCWATNQDRLLAVKGPLLNLPLFGSCQGS